MTKLNLAAIAMAGMLAVACGTNTNQAQAEKSAQPKAVIAYFSGTGNTKAVAEKLQEVTNADLVVIVPEQEYTAEDLDYRNRECRSIVEAGDSTARPALKEVADLSQYDVVYLGYPIWSNIAPRIINTFIESQKLEGKTIYTFCTCGGGSGDNSSVALSKTYPQLDIKDCKTLKSNHIANPDSVVVEWAKTF